MARTRPGNPWMSCGSNNSPNCFNCRNGTKADPAPFIGHATLRIDQAEAGVTHMEIKALEHDGRTATVWTRGYDGETHYADVFKALAPALFILTTAAALMLAIL